MKYLLIGDSHWGISNCNQRMIQQNIEVWDYILKISESRKVDAILEAGDFLDKRKDIDAQLLQTIKQEVLDKLTCPLYLLVGNHNTYYKTTSLVNNIEAFNNYNKFINIVDKPLNLNNVISIIPWVDDSNIAEITKYITKDTNKYCLGHFEFNGFPFDKTTVSECKEKISRSSFNMYGRVLSGHYHIQSKKDNVIYLGTPCQLTWIDENIEKYIYILDTETDELEEILIPYTLYHKYDLEKYEDIVPSFLSGKRVIFYYDDNIEKDYFNSLQTRIQQLGTDSVQFIKRKNTNIKKQELVLDEQKPLLDNILDYIENIKPDNQNEIEFLIKKIYNPNI